MTNKFLQTLIAVAGFVLCFGAMGQSTAAQPTSSPSTSSSSKMFTDPYMRVGFGGAWYNKFKASSFGNGVITNQVYGHKRPSVSPSFHFGVGFNIIDDFRTDLTLRYSEVKYKYQGDSQKITTFDVMANAYYDVNINKIVVPYIAGGLGVARNNSGSLLHLNTQVLAPYFNGSSLSQSGKISTNLAWNIGLGLKFNFGKDYAVDLGYRYGSIGKVKIAPTNLTSAPFFPGISPLNYPAVSQKLTGHQGMLSLIYKF